RDWRKLPRLNSITFIVTALLISYGLLRYKLLNIIPTGREKVVESMNDGVLVIDFNGKLLVKNLRMKLNLIKRRYLQTTMSKHWQEIIEYLSEFDQWLNHLILPALLF